ncbi:hypothetical protein NHX12_007616, partial [Muraenolepis orangiensis]
SSHLLIWPPILVGTQSYAPHRRSGTQQQRTPTPREGVRVLNAPSPSQWFVDGEGVSFARLCL